MSDRIKIALLLLPALAVLGGLFLGGLAIGAVRSLNVMPVIGLTMPDLAAYRAVLSDREVWRGLLLSLHIAVTATLLSAGIAVWTALLLRRTRPGRRLVHLLFRLNLTVPHLVGAVGILYLVSQSGSFARIAAATGLIDRPAEFPALVFDPAALGIILAYVWKEVPFIGVIVLSAMQTLGEDHESVARTLGATPWQAFRHVLLPAIAPGLTTACVIVFAFTFGAYEVPALLGASYPAALPVLAYRLYTDVDLAARPEAMALALLIAAVSAALLAVAMRAARRQAGREDG